MLKSLGVNKWLSWSEDEELLHDFMLTDSYISAVFSIFPVFLVLDYEVEC